MTPSPPRHTTKSICRCSLPRTQPTCQRTEHPSPPAISPLPTPPTFQHACTHARSHHTHAKLPTNSEAFETKFRGTSLAELAFTSVGLSTFIIQNEK